MKPQVSNSFYEEEYDSFEIEILNYTCLTCQGTGYAPSNTSDDLNEPYYLGTCWDCEGTGIDYYS